MASGSHIVLTPSFRYKNDVDVGTSKLSTDLFWNSTKGVAGGNTYSGDWRGGAQADPESGVTRGRRRRYVREGDQVSSYRVLDQMAEMLDDVSQFPSLEQVIIGAHSAGGQLVQRYAMMTKLFKRSNPAPPRVPFTFLVADPSSYAYLDKRRYQYTCGSCTCGTAECTCTGACTWDEQQLVLKDYKASDAGFVCADENADSWGYGLETLSPSYPYVQERGVAEAARYSKGGTD